MQYTCFNCGRCIKTPDAWERETFEHFWCEECAEKIEERLIRRDAELRRQLANNAKDLAEVSRGDVKIEVDPSPLVYSGISKIAKALDADIEVAELEELPDSYYTWDFWVRTNNLNYRHFGTRANKEDAKIAEKWRDEHDTF